MKNIPSQKKVNMKYKRSRNASNISQAIREESSQLDDG